MRILGIVCSPRIGGNTEILIREALEAVREAGYEADLILLADKNISPCDGCGSCIKNGICKIKDDMQMIYEQLALADGIIFGTPVYFANVSAQAKAVIDRSYAILGVRTLRGKVASAIVAARRVGASQVLSHLYTFFTIHRMVIASGGVGYGMDKGEVREGVGGTAGLSALQEARAVGRNTARMLRQLSK